MTCCNHNQNSASTIMVTPSILNIIGYACGLGGPDTHSGLGPLMVQKKLNQSTQPISYRWSDTLYPRAQFEKTEKILDCCTRLALHTQHFTLTQQPFLVVGGDHSCAIGTWSGVSTAQEAPIGMLWIDAHLDSHTPQTTLSHNIHGMPLAALLGHGDPRFTQINQPHIKLSAQHVCILGARNPEPQEQALLQQLGVHIYTMEDIQQQGLTTLLQQAYQHVALCPAGFGISFDLDALDPEYAPGVSTPEPNGLSPTELFSALGQCIQPTDHFLGAEIAEFNPSQDTHDATLNICMEWIKMIYSLHPHLT